MKPGPKPKPTLELINPGRRKLREPIDGGSPLVDVPENIPDYLRDTYAELLEAIPEGIAQRPDAILVEMLARLIHKVRGMDKPVASDMAQLRLLCEAFRISPSGRQRFQKAPGVNRFAALGPPPGNGS